LFSVFGGQLPLTSSGAELEAGEVFEELGAVGCQVVLG
jgi:hypothetical protein